MGGRPTILGLSTGVAYVGSLVGAPMAGWVYDAYGSYEVAWFIMASVAFAGMVSFMTTPPAGSAIVMADKSKDGASAF